MGVDGGGEGRGQRGDCKREKEKMGKMGGLEHDEGRHNNDAMMFTCYHHDHHHHQKPSSG